MKCKKGLKKFLGILIPILFLSLVLFFLCYIMIDNKKRRECFGNIAKEYCQKRGYESYNLLDYEFRFKNFECINNREIVGKFLFTKQDIKTCPIWNPFVENEQNKNNK